MFDFQEQQILINTQVIKLFLISLNIYTISKYFIKNTILNLNFSQHKYFLS